MPRRRDASESEARPTEADASLLSATQANVRDPLALIHVFWPRETVYDKQVEIVESVRRNKQTFVPAAHQMGKDWIAGKIALGAFLFPQAFLLPPGTPGPAGTVRIVTTSVRDDHLRVLWGEIRQFVDTCAFPLEAKRGGPLVVLQRELRKLTGDPRIDAISYCLGTVSERGEGLTGHHADYTLGIVDEASGVDDMVYERLMTWCKRLLVIGNPYGSSGFFKAAVKGGDILAP